MSKKRDHSDLSYRMKRYESVTHSLLMRRSYTIIRLDGKAFHTYTKNLEKPFDKTFVKNMNETAQYLCKNLQNVKMAYVQSDEISLLITDFDNLETEMIFNGNIQKICSVSASFATSIFNNLRLSEEVMIVGELGAYQILTSELAHFDSRVFQLPTKTEVENYFIWRQKDCMRNCVSSVAQSMFSHNELQCKKQEVMIDMIKDAGGDFNQTNPDLKFGRFFFKDDNFAEVNSFQITEYKTILSTRIPEN